jgi:hypothetical protein
MIFISFKNLNTKQEWIEIGFHNTFIFSTKKHCLKVESSPTFKTFEAVPFYPFIIKKPDFYLKTIEEKKRMLSLGQFKFPPD